MITSLRLTQYVTKLAYYQVQHKQSYPKMKDDSHFFNSFSKTWREDYQKSAHDIQTATITQVKDYYMSEKKDGVDKAYKRKKANDKNN